MSISIAINKVLSRFGYSIVKPENWRPKNNFERLNLPAEVEHHVRNNSMLSEIRLKNIVDISSYLLQNNIYGDFVECGVWKGGSVALMAYIMKEQDKKRMLHLFDAFDDICEPDANVDGERAIELVGGKENAQGRLQAVKGVYDYKGGHGNDVEAYTLITEKIDYDKKFVKVHKGWFQDTLPMAKNEIDKIALLRLDGDWYSSTKVCLENLYDKVVNNGIIIIDDYGAYEGCKKAVDEFLNERNLTPFMINVDDYCLYWVKYEK